MSDEKALLAAIWEHPHEDTPRLMYADWLDEQGDPAKADRAELIRIQCELAILSPRHARYPALAKRERQLLKTRRKEWIQSLKKSHQKSAPFWRGFPVPILADRTVEGLAKLAESALRDSPLWRYPVVTDRTFDAFLKCPQLHRMTTLQLHAPSLRKNWVKQVAGCDGLRNVTELAFTDCPLTPTGLKTILDAWTHRRLTSIWVNECLVGDRGIEIIAKHPATASLRTLRAHSAEITQRGVEAIVGSPHLEGVTVATFAHNGFGASGGKLLLRWKALESIRELYLMNAGITRATQNKFRKQLGNRVHF